MDSLLASYASSDEDDEEQQHPKQQEQEQIRQQETDYPSQTNPNKPSSSIFSFLPPPKSSLFNSLPPPKSNLPNPTQTLIKNPQSPKPNTQFKEEEGEEDSELGKQSSSVFSSLPQPKSSSPLFSFLPPPKTHESDSKPPANLSSLSDPKPKRVVQFRPPINAAFLKSRDADSEDEDDKEERERKRSRESAETPTVKSFLSSIPAPKNSMSLGSLPSSGSGRRSIIEADVQASTYKEIKTENVVNEVGVNSNAGNYEGQLVQESYSTSVEAPSGSSGYAVGGGNDSSYWELTNENPVNYDSHGYGNYAAYGQYSGNWVDRSGTTAAMEISEMTESLMKVPGKRGRSEIPQEIIEVRQDELIKDRPREDQSKLTGIAFGPSYQPTSSAKGKPTKLHKRKHQIGSLYFDMRQKEMELAERRAKGFLTKSETQAKYGW